MKQNTDRFCLNILQVIFHCEIDIFKDTNYLKKSYKTFQRRYDIILNVGAGRFNGERTNHNSLGGITVSLSGRRKRKEHSVGELMAEDLNKQNNIFLFTNSWANNQGGEWAYDEWGRGDFVTYQLISITQT